MSTQVNHCASAGIDKLVEVKNTLKKVNDWQSLGLQLGLLYPTLEKIETDNNSKVEQCKTKMIAAWLKRQDNVLKVGVPSWSVLKAALRKIGEGEVADQIVTWCEFERTSLLHDTVCYRIYLAGNISGYLILWDWRFSKQTTKLKSAEIQD